MILPKDELAEVRRLHPGTMLDKYFDSLDRTTEEMVRYARVAGVGPGTKVLDIGCGLGIFGWVCKQLGACVVNVDSPMGVVFAATHALGITYVPHNIRRDNPLPLDLWGFDLITTFHVTIGDQGGLWLAQDYRRMMVDGLARLNQGGSWLWRMNRGPVVAEVLGAMRLTGARMEYPVAGDDIMARIFPKNDCLQS